MLNEGLISAAFPAVAFKGALTTMGDDTLLFAEVSPEANVDDKGQADRLAKRLSTLATMKSSATPGFGRSKKTAASEKKKRAKDRTPTFRAGRVIFSGRSETPCVIKDLSDLGARIVLEGEASLPPLVTLVIATTGSRKEARVVWQDEREVGLSFGGD